MDYDDNSTPVDAVEAESTSDSMADDAVGMGAVAGYNIGEISFADDPEEVEASSEGINLAEFAEVGEGVDIESIGTKKPKAKAATDVEGGASAVALFDPALEGMLIRPSTDGWEGQE